MSLFEAIFGQAWPERNRHKAEDADEQRAVWRQLMPQRYPRSPLEKARKRAFNDMSISVDKQRNAANDPEWQERQSEAHSAIGRRFLGDPQRKDRG